MYFAWKSDVSTYCTRHDCPLIARDTAGFSESFPSRDRRRSPCASRSIPIPANTRRGGTPSAGANTRTGAPPAGVRSSDPVVDRVPARNARPSRKDDRARRLRWSLHAGQRVAELLLDLRELVAVRRDPAPGVELLGVEADPDVPGRAIVAPERLEQPVGEIGRRGLQARVLPVVLPRPQTNGPRRCRRRSSRSAARRLRWPAASCRRSGCREVHRGSRDPRPAAVVDSVAAVVDAADRGQAVDGVAGLRGRRDLRIGERHHRLV